MKRKPCVQGKNKNLYLQVYGIRSCKDVDQICKEYKIMILKGYLLI